MKFNLMNNKNLILKIVDTTIYFVHLHKKDDILYIDNFSKFTSIEEAKKTVSKFKNIHIVISPENRIYEQVKISSKIKDKKIILYSIKKELSSKYSHPEKIIFKYYFEETAGDYSEYLVDGFYDDELKKYEMLLTNIENIEFATLDTYSFNSMISLALKNKKVPHISVYEEEKNLLFLANDGERVVFSRTIPLYEAIGGSGRNFKIIENIIQNSRFVFQKNFVPNCELMFLCGSFSEDDTLLLMLKDSMKDIRLTSIYPYTTIKGIPPIKFYEYLTILGAYVKNSDYDYTPRFIKRKKQLTFLNNFLIIVFSLLLTFNVLTIYSFKTDIELLEKENSILLKNFKQLKKYGKLYSLDELDVINNFYYLKKKLLENNIVLNMEELYEPLMMYDKKSVEITKNNEKKLMNISANKQFKNLMELNVFVQKVESLSKNKSFVVYHTIDYKIFTITSNFSFNETPIQNEISTPERRRRQ